MDLTFVDETGAVLPKIRRTQTRTSRGKLDETAPNLNILGLDPIAFRMGTVIPGLLQFIQVGSPSELGKAVAELTGLAALVDLAGHATRTKRRIDGDFVRAREADITAADEAYGRTRTDLLELIKQHPAISPDTLPPSVSKDRSIEEALNALVQHFEGEKAKALRAAQDVLGESFDPTNADARSDLEGNIGPALAELKQLGRLASAARLAALGKLTPEMLSDARMRLEETFREADILAGLARDPSQAARTRLYARVAAWMQEHPDQSQREDQCAVCGGDLREVLDPVTGRPVTEHLNEALTTDAALLSQTLMRWAQATLAALTRDLPQALQSELSLDLPNHPSDLVRAALIDELFSTTPFVGVLANLKSATAEALDAAVAGWPSLTQTTVGTLPSGLGDLSALQIALSRLDRALRFAVWRRDNDAAISVLLSSVIGLASSVDRQTAQGSLSARLTALDATVKGAAPITSALAACSRLKADLLKRRNAERRLADYATASAALEEIIRLGALAEQQVEQLRRQLHESAATWRGRISASAFPATQQELVETGMSSEGHLELLVGTHGVAAPAQHVANASALRASLVGFYFAFWEYVLRERGGLKLLLLDDPQELLDEENRERLAHAFLYLLDADAQLVVATYDRRFAGHVTTAIRKGTAIDHRSIHPVTPTRPTLQTAPSVAGIQRRRDAHEKDLNNPDAARDYVSECRVFLEARFGDLFDDAAYPAWSATNPAPTMMDHINRLRGLVKAPPSDLFRSQALRDLSSDAALKDGAPTLALLNKAHHQKHEITPQDVAAAAADLIRLQKSAEKAHEECRRWRRREKLSITIANVRPLVPTALPNVRVYVQRELAAFSRGAAVGDTQDIAAETLDSTWLDDKALFYLRCDNFGFAAPRTAIAIVEASPSAVEDRTLVIARHGTSVFARRLLRSANSGMVALTAETPDPRRSPPTLLMHETEVALHRVVGVLFDDRLPSPEGKTEAVPIDESRVLERIESAYRVKEDSAVPLALPGQIVLGEPSIRLDDFGKYPGAMVALYLDDESSIFKRVGSRLPWGATSLWQFESIGGLGMSEVLSLGQPVPGFRSVVAAVLIVGVLYYG